LLAFVIITTGLIVPSVSRAQAVEPVITQEYFIQQAVDEDLFITINAFEAEFQSRVTGSNGEILLLSGIKGSRIVPVFQYIHAPKSSRQLNIGVTSSLHTGRTEFGIELTRLKPWDSRSSSVSQAYKLLSFGTEIGDVDSQANWTLKINSVFKASQLFEQYGMQEMRLWSNYLTAHLIQFHLHDHSIVYSMTRELLADLRGTRLKKIELATMQLQSLALIGLKRSGSLTLSADNIDPVQVALSQTAELAEAMGYDFEQARALFASGVEYADQSLYSSALEKFQLAVKAADSVGSAELATAIRESIVQIHTIQGDAPSTSEVLQEIESQLVEDGGGDELALNLLAQARLLMTNYHYGEALEVLSGALNYENNSAIRKQINFELAKILYETGRLDEALNYLQLAGINPDNSQKRSSNPVIDVGEGLRILANTHRMRGEYERMQEARSAEGQYRVATDQYLYDQGLDAIARAGKNSQQAPALFKKSFEAANTAGHIDLKHLARLQYCRLSGPADGVCSKGDLNASYEWLRVAGVPKFTAEAMFLRAQGLNLNGQRSEALDIMEQLIDEIHLLRHSLAGVLGAWFWERHEQVFETWIGMLLADSKQRNSKDGLVSLRALSKVRYIEKYTGIELDSSSGSDGSDRLRALLAQRADPASGMSAVALNDNINTALDNLRINFRKKFEFLSIAWLQKYLRSLAKDEMVLTYHISPAIAAVWVGHNGKVQRRDIANPADVYRALQASRQNLESTGLTAFNRKMEELGTRLITPVADLLTETIYWIPAGPFLGFPADALRVNGRYLVERHRVVNLLSFPANINPGSSLQVRSLERVFLAGNPQDYSGDYANRLETSSEIRAVTDIFVGPGLQIIQGVALLPDEFRSPDFLQANLIHLSMPGIINLKYPNDSGLELSEGEYEPGRVVLKPKAIRAQKLSAGMLFLSSTRITGSPLSEFSSQPGFVSDFLDTGADSVLVNFWSGGAESDEGFITDFYRTLQASGDIAASLHESRLRYLRKNRLDGLYDWAGYQLYIR
jgi:CHAT domain-containing protein/tetratricopeptide (TPR) repeat protein